MDPDTPYFAHYLLPIMNKYSCTNLETSLVIMKFATLFSFFSILPYFGYSIVCYRCQNGYATSEVCSNRLVDGFTNECDGPNSQCFESIQWFNDGALRLAVRDCWTPPANSTGGYCDSYESPEGVLKYCRNCTEDLCNTDVIYYPVKLLNCYL